MNILNIEDKLARGLGIAARKLGVPTTVYRPVGIAKPLSNEQRCIRIQAAFEPNGSPVNSKGVASPIWRGVFDTYYTRQADYLVTKTDTFFIGSQTPGLPTQCILTNRTVSINRATFVIQGGYSGLSDAESQTLIDGWPASLTEIGGSSPGQRPNGQGFGTWAVLLPVLPTALRVADLMTDDLGSTYVVDSAEQNMLGWRLLARQIGA